MTTLSTLILKALGAFFGINPEREVLVWRKAR